MGVETEESLVPSDNYNFELRDEIKLFCLKFWGIILVLTDESGFLLKPQKITAFYATIFSCF